MEPRGATGEGAHPAERYRFGGVLVDATAHTITRGGQPHPVEPKAFAVLLVLLHHPGELVLRDDLLDAVWGHRHVTPGVLTRAIAQLRGALDDHAHEPRYIQTQHALGYRFIGELAPAPAPVIDPVPAPAQASLPAPIPTLESSPAAPVARSTDAGARPIAAAVPPADARRASPAGARVGQPVLPVV
ncbi:winged helix-turn-helix domain-containing protein, partial [Lysobacter sp. D1-1-M9]